MGLLRLWIPRCHGLCTDRVGGRLSPTSEIDITSSPKSPRLRLPGCRGHQWPNHHRLPVASNPRCVVFSPRFLISLEIQPQVSNLRRYRPTSKIHRGGKTSTPTIAPLGSQREWGGAMTQTWRASSFENKDSSDSSTLWSSLVAFYKIANENKQASISTSWYPGLVCWNSLLQPCPVNSIWNPWAHGLLSCSWFLVTLTQAPCARHTESAVVFSGT